MPRPREGAYLQTTPHTSRGLDAVFATLVPIDHELRHHTRHIQHVVEGLSKVGTQEKIRADLEAQLKWLVEHLDLVTHLNTKEDRTNKLLHQEMEKNLKELLVAVRSIMTTLVDRTTEDVSPKETVSSIVDTGVEFS